MSNAWSALSSDANSAAVISGDRHRLCGVDPKLLHDHSIDYPKHDRVWGVPIRTSQRQNLTRQKLLNGPQLGM
jgi:hypothetical protein